MTICPKCGKEFLNVTKRKFCSRECANSRIHSEMTKKKISLSVSKNSKKGNCSHMYKIYLKNKNDYLQNPKYCPVCKNLIPYKRRKYITCSNDCKLKILGGYREKGGRGYNGHYKGFYCNSQWELGYVIFCLDHNIPIKRNKEFFIYEYKSKKYKYYPDFVINNILIEIKGYHQPLVDIKLSCVNKPIKILYQKDLQYVFDYIKEKYQKDKKHIYELYERV